MIVGSVDLYELHLRIGGRFVMEANHSAFPIAGELYSSGLTKYEYAVIEMAKALIIANPTSDNAVCSAHHYVKELFKDWWDKE